jgi:hypothetical protein
MTVLQGILGRSAAQWPPRQVPRAHRHQRRVCLPVRQAIAAQALQASWASVRGAWGALGAEALDGGLPRQVRRADRQVRLAVTQHALAAPKVDVLVPAHMQWHVCDKTVLHVVLVLRGPACCLRTPHGRHAWLSHSTRRQHPRLRSSETAHEGRQLAAAVTHPPARRPCRAH